MNKSEVQQIDINDVLDSPILKAQWIAGLNSPYYFIKYFLAPSVLEISEKHPKQLQFLHEATNSLEGILCCASRSGKTFTLSLLHLWFLVYRKHWHTSYFLNDYSKQFATLNVCLTLNQAKYIFDNILQLVDDSPFFRSFPFIQRIDRGQNPAIETCLNSIHEAKSSAFGGRGILGSEYSLLSIDECASEPDLNHLRYRTVGTRRTSTSGRLFFASTPTGQATFREYWFEFKERKKKGEPVCLARFSRFDNPVNNPAQINFEMASMPQIEVNEEIFGRFSDYSSTYFPASHILQAFNPELPIHIPLDEPETGNCDPLSYTPLNKVNSTYFSGLDIAGAGIDSTVLITLELVRNFNSINHINLVSYQRVSKMGLLGANGIIERVKRCFSNYGVDSHQLFYDASSLGGGQLTEVMQHYLPKEMLDNTTGITSSRKPGRSSFNHKYLMLSNLAHMLEKGQLSIPDVPELNQLKKELRFYMYPDDKGLSTDTVMALSLATYAHAYHASENPNFSDLFFYMQDRLETNYQPYAS